MTTEDKIATNEKDYHPAALSFSQLEQITKGYQAQKDILELASTYAGLIHNILGSSEVEDVMPAIQNLSNEFEERVESTLRTRKEKWQPLTDKATEIVTNLTGKEVTKVEGGVKYVASDYAYVPSTDKPSTWKLRLATERSGNITAEQLGRAAAAFSPGGFRGNRVQLPADAVARVKARVRSEYEKLGVTRIPDSVKALNTFTTFKQADGQTRWLAIYSNNIIDDDNPPDILSKEAHEEFAAAVETKEAETPQLWLWHNKDWNMGKADFVSTSEADGVTMALATGTFRKGLENVMKQFDGIELGVSHGMVSDSIVRDENERKVITRYRSKEISVLPLRSAANKFTNFIVLGEEQTMLKEEKARQLLEMGVPQEAIDQIEAVTLQTSQAVKQADLEVKEETPKEESPPAETPPEVDPVMEALGGITSRLEAIETRMSGTDTQVNELKQLFNQTPAESLFGKALPEDDPITKKNPEHAKEAGDDQPFFMNWLQGGA